MGAPGEAFFCRRGHLYHMIGDDLYWGEDLSEESKRFQTEGCPCGEKDVEVLRHYGGLNDCTQWDAKRIGVVTLRSPIPHAVNASGNTIEAFVESKFDVYDVSQLFEGRRL